MNLQTSWDHVNADVFWGEIAPADHVLQIYESDDILLDSLAGFIGGGIKAGECVLIIASGNHLTALHRILTSFGISVSTLVSDERYIPLNAEAILSKFMRNGYPDEQLFGETISFLFEKAVCKDRRVRVFNELVGVLWEKGYHGAAIQLENQWNQLKKIKIFTLFCAYLKAGFTSNSDESIRKICDCHSKIIDGSKNQLKEVVYTSQVRAAV
ncbi:MAG TPA: MEDS domain-containing protein [Chitinophagaceae bacterium]|nr:MEDS domain-containing protein [Chitinophagaceae bacterium]